MINDGGYSVGLDLGTSKIAVAVGVCLDRGRFDVYGVGLAETRGVRNETVVDSDALTDAIVSAVEEAELVAGLEITDVCLGLSGSHVLGINGRGAITTDRVIEWSDRRRAFGAAVSAVAIPDGREILQVIWQDFIVDGQDAVTCPEGLTIASPLEARAHVITYDAAYGTALMDCVRRAELTIRSTRSSLMGASEAALDSNEKELGVAVIDIGVESTGIAIFDRGLLRDTRALGLGGSAFTQAVADGLRLMRPEAERVKRALGTALPATPRGTEATDIPRGCGQSALFFRRELSEILQDQADRFFRLVQSVVPEAAYALNSGLVLTGRALLPGMADVAEQVFDLPVRYGRPALTGDLAARIDGAPFTAAVGLAQLAHRHDGRPTVAPRLPRPPASWTG